MIRRAAESDFQSILSLIDSGRRIMRESGNPGQWPEGKPEPEKIRKDIENGNSWIVEENGIHIPDDVQVIGYDGIINFATGRYVCSTIVQPLAEMAQKAVDLLLSPDGYPRECVYRLPVKYVPGGTTKDAPPAIGDDRVYNPFRSAE